jgi:hypothetical protein
MGVFFPHLNMTDGAGPAIARHELLHVTKPQSNPTEADTIMEKRNTRGTADAPSP